METIKRTLKSGDSAKGDISKLAFELLNGVTKVHLNHLRISGPGSFAGHKAMNEFYDAIGDMADRLIEEYQGLTEKLLTFPTSYDFPTMSNAKECLVYLRTLYNTIDSFQESCQYSEINNQLDEVKSLINSTKYKLLFLA